MVRRRNPPEELTVYVTGPQHVVYVIECPAPFEQIGSSCLYLETDDGKKSKWSKARLECRALGGDLAILNTDERHQDAEDLVKMHGIGTDETGTKL